MEVDVAARQEGLGVFILQKSDRWHFGHLGGTVWTAECIGNIIRSGWLATGTKLVLRFSTIGG